MKGLKGFSQVKRTGEKKKVFGELPLFNFADYAGERLVFRLLGPIRGYAMHWIEIKTKTGKNVKIPKMCLNYNMEDDSFGDNGCPYCNLDSKSGRKYLVNAIWRSAQDKEPKKVERTKKESKKQTIFEDYECYIKDPSSKSWTPVVVLNLPVGIVSELNELGKNNLNKKGEAFDVNDAKFGVDISILYRPEKAGESKYRVDSLERTPLTDEEKEYLIYNLEDIPMESMSEAKEEYKNLKKVAVLEEEEDDEDVDSIDYDDEDETSKKKSKKSRDDDDDDEEDEEDERPSKKNKSKKSKYDDDDEDDEDDEEDEDSDDEDEEDDDDEDEKPRKKSKSKYDDDEDDDDFEDEDEDEKPRKNKKSKYDDDEDDDDFDDDEDERPSKKSKKKSKKSRDDDDDDDDDFDDLD